MASLVLESLGVGLLGWALICLLFGVLLEATRPPRSKGGSPEAKQWFVVLVIFASPFMALLDWLRSRRGRQRSLG